MKDNDKYVQVTPWLNIPERSVKYFEAVEALMRVVVMNGPPTTAMEEEVSYARIGIGGAFAAAMGYLERDVAQAEMNSLAGAVVAAIEHSEKQHAINQAQSAINRAKESSNGELH